MIYSPVQNKSVRSSFFYNTVFAEVKLFACCCAFSPVVMASTRVSFVYRTVPSGVVIFSSAYISNTAPDKPLTEYSG